VSPADVQVPAVRSAGVVLLQLEIPLAAVAAAVQTATGIVVLNPAPTRPLPDELLDAVDVLVPNEWELFRLAGLAARPASLERLAAIARTIPTRNVVVTLGERGALVVPRDGRIDHVPAPAVTAVDTTGAGDCFCGALSVSLACGASLVEAARYAVGAAALSTTAAGARGYLPDDAAVRSVLSSGVGTPAG
jgi:ribokinase